MCFENYPDEFIRLASAPDRKMGRISADIARAELVIYAGVDALTACNQN